MPSDLMRLSRSRLQKTPPDRAMVEKKAELDAAIQAEHVKATLFEDEASIGAFYKSFAQATIDTPETREQLFSQSDCRP